MPAAIASSDRALCHRSLCRIGFPTAQRGEDVSDYRLDQYGARNQEYAPYSEQTRQRGQKVTSTGITEWDETVMNQLMKLSRKRIVVPFFTVKECLFNGWYEQPF